MLPFPISCRLGERFAFEGFGPTAFDGGVSTLISKSTVEMKSAAANKSHSEAEKRRRERINGHLERLRTLLPNLTKKDKASLLAEVVRQVKQLKTIAADVVLTTTEANSMIWPFPGEKDEVTLDFDPRSSLLKASVCCEDRPGLMADLNAALRSLHLRAVKAEIATLGGRTKTIFFIDREVIKQEEENGAGKGEYVYDEYVCICIRRALKAALNKPAITSVTEGVSSSPTSSAPALMLMGNYKRPRLSHQLSL